MIYVKPDVIRNGLATETMIGVFRSRFFLFVSMETDGSALLLLDTTDVVLVTA